MRCQLAIPFASPSALAHGELKRSVRLLQIDRLILRLTPSSITFIRKAFLRALPSVLNATAAENFSISAATKIE